MDLSPEEKRKVYEEEKARIEAEERQRTVSNSSTTLKPNVAGLLCYLGGWITGIIFVVIEQKNTFVRFHAVQSIVVFGGLNIAIALLGWIPIIGNFFNVVFGILIFFCWIFLMVKAYQHELYKFPIASSIAESIIPLDNMASGEKPEAEEKVATGTTQTNEKGSAEAAEPPEQPASAGLIRGKQLDERLNKFFKGTRAGRTTASSFTIAWSIFLLIFFSFFHEYIANYHSSTFYGGTTWTKEPLLTGDYYIWLPILITTLLLSIAGHIILIIYDKYWLREVITILLNVLGIVTVVTLVAIFPFNFNVIPSSTAADIVDVSVRIGLIAIVIGMSIGTIVMLIKFIINLAKSASD